jgi:hypothetical protein
MDEYAEVVRATGHENVSGTHGSTWEVTSDDYLTPAGDCILGIEADAVPAEFDDSFVEACQSADASIRMALETTGQTVEVLASGHPDLTFESDRSLVVRTSDYIDDRTVAINATKAAADIDRDLVSSLEAESALTLTLTVERDA